MCKRIPVVGDWIKSPVWATGTYFEVSRMSSTYLWVKVGGDNDVSYPINSHDWVFKTTPIEEAQKLLTEAGFTVTPPPPKLTGKVAVYKYGSGTYATDYNSYEAWGASAKASYPLVAVLDWTEGDGL